MTKVPTDINGFVNLEPWWRIKVPTEVILSKDGVNDLLAKIDNEKKKPFFVIDEVLHDQPVFKELFNRKASYLFNASESEPRTGDVDKLVSLIKSFDDQPDILVGIGGGATMDLTKATGICLANPGSAQKYQGYRFDMNRGVPVWVLPTLNGTGAEITPIAVLRGPEKKLGINNAYVSSHVAIVDPQLTVGARKFNRFFTMVDCYFHHYEIMKSKTSSFESIKDAEDGYKLSREVLMNDLSNYKLELAIKSAMASILGGSSTIGGRVGAIHAISYGLSNSGPKLPHSVAVAMSIFALGDIYPDGYKDIQEFLHVNNMQMPKASDYGITRQEIDKMTKTALGMDKLWNSCFGDDWKSKTTRDFISGIYEKIVVG
jgi:3-deoxy-alpha-D-manno-octulosonate 8-oxidase